MVQEETVLSMLKTPGCPLSPIWMAWYYVGRLAACAERQKQLSHLLHSIFICQPASGEAWGDLDPPRRSIFVQQVKLRSKEPPKQTSFTPRWGEKPIHHWAERKILIQECNQVPRRIGGDYGCHLFLYDHNSVWPQMLHKLSLKDHRENWTQLVKCVTGAERREIWAFQVRMKHRLTGFILDYLVQTWCNPLICVLTCAWRWSKPIPPWTSVAWHSGRRKSLPNVSSRAALTSGAPMLISWAPASTCIITQGPHNKWKGVSSYPDSEITGAYKPQNTMHTNTQGLWAIRSGVRTCLFFHQFSQCFPRIIKL